jgi:hypothetical protein
VGSRSGDLFAENVAFRSEHAEVASLAYLGQYVDGTAGEGHVCNVTIDDDPE